MITLDHCPARHGSTRLGPAAAARPMGARLTVPRPMAGWQGLVLGRAEDGWLVDQVRLKLEPKQRKTSGAQFGTVNGFISPKDYREPYNGFS